MNAPPRTARRYVITMLMVVAVFLAALATMNLVMDPLGYARAAGWWVERPTEFEKTLASAGAWPVPHGTREAKILNVRTYRPTTVYFGSSTVWSYIDAGYKPLLWSDGRRAYNFGLAGATVREIEAVFEHTVALQAPKRIVVGLEFYMFSADKPSSPDFDALPMAHKPTYRADLWRFMSRRVFAADYAWASAALLVKPFAARLADWLATPVSAAERDAAPMTRAEFAKVMLDVDKVIITALYPDNGRAFRFVDDAGWSSLDAVRRMVGLARANQIDLRLYLTPHHARAFETIRLLGWWPQFEEWQRGLVAILAEDAAAHPDQAPIPLWDFCCYNDVTTGRIADLPEGAGFRDFADQIHFKAHVGLMLMDRIFASEATAALPPNFGVLLSAGNVDTHLTAIRDSQQRYVAEHPDDVAAVRSALHSLGRRLP